VSRLRVRGRRGGLWLALAGAAGLVAAVLTLRAAAQPGDGGWVLVARTPIAPGVLIDAQSAHDALAVAPVPQGLRLSGVLTAPDQAVGRRTAAPIGANEPLTQAALGGAPGTVPAPLAAGERAVAVPVSAAGGAAGLLPGARVDVVASTGEGPAGRTAVVVADAEVLAVADPASSADVGAAGEALLRVSSAQALRVTAALNFAREVRLLLRPGDEIGPAGGPSEVGAP
jgi:Flp pilus assembly protein CpaB